jgi:hypothetical protein
MPHKWISNPRKGYGEKYITRHEKGCKRKKTAIFQGKWVDQPGQAQ